MSLQENEAEGIPHATMYLFSLVSIVETGTERICHTFQRLALQPWAHLPNMAILVHTPPFEPILMNQDDSKQWEHLLSQENGPS